MDSGETYPEIYDRKTLYQEVWAEPVKIVANRYGVSDVALAKTCRKLAIPLPGRGYWARVRSGQKLPRTPLGPLPSGTPESLPVFRMTIAPERAPSAPTAVRMAAEEKEESAIEVGEVLERPHPLVRDTKKWLTMRNPPSVASLDVSVSRESLDRALRILDALLKALKSRGLVVEVRERSRSDQYRAYHQETFDPIGTRVNVEGEWVAFRLEERSRVVVPDPPEPPKHLRGIERERWVENRRPYRRLEYNGVLVLRFRNVDYLDVRKEWKDGARKKLEEQLNDVVAHLYLAGEALRQKRIEHDEAERARAERERREYEDLVRRQEEEKKAKELSGLLERWRLARDIREFVAEALALGADPKITLDWALAYADKIDPLDKLRRAKASEE